MAVEFLILGLAVLVAAVGSFVAARASIGSGGLWPAAWVLVLVGITVDQIHHSGVSMWLGHLFGTLFAGLILAGAIRFVGKPLPRWLLPAALLLGLTRAALAASGEHTLAGLIALIPEPAAELFAAYLVHNYSRSPGVPIQQRLLAPALLLLSAIDVWTGVVTLVGGDRVPLSLAWLVGASILSLLQLTTFLEQLKQRIRDRSAELARRNTELRGEIDVRVRAEEALRLSEERYRKLSELNSDFSFVVRLDGAGRNHLEWATGAYERITGYTIEETQLGGWDAFVYPEDVERVRHFFGSSGVGETVSLEYRIVCKDGSICWVEQFGVLELDEQSGVRRLFGACHDITWRKDAEAAKERLEARMREAQKLESLGVLAGGVAHDFNNLLTVILGNTAIVLADLPKGSPHARRLERVRKTAQYAADLTGQMLAYAGSTVLASKPVDLSRLVEDMLGLLSPELDAKVLLSSEFPGNLPIVDGDDSRLRQVVHNLVTNAAEALGEAGGRLSVRTGLMHVGSQDLADVLPNSEFEGEEAVYLEVRDDGPGIDAETRSRIFEPFYSTKSFAPGTKVSGRGLGLAAVLGIVRAHGGVIQLQTAPGEGTCFRILLPTHRPVEQDESPAREPVAAKGEATLLLIDDDEMVREVACEFLKRAGYRVLLAASGSEGLELLEQHAGEVGLVLLDFVMPDLAGEVVLERIRETAPDLPVVVVTGYPQEARGGADRLTLAGYLEKPYDPEALIAVVEDALEGRTPA